MRRGGSFILGVTKKATTPKQEPWLGKRISMVLTQI